VRLSPVSGKPLGGRPGFRRSPGGFQMKNTLLILLLLLGTTSCASTQAPAPLQPVMARPFVIWPDGRPLPAEGYDRPPKLPFSPSDLFIQLDEMRTFYGPPGEFGYYMDGGDYGFNALSFIVTETHPGGGPDLHKHDSEEAHILFSGKVTYLIGEKRFTVEGPYIARVPAGIAHTFVNAGPTPFHLLAAFPTPHPAYIHIGDNPLIARPGHQTPSDAPHR
jgi:mannose-6-phosphate isomerase-like protein (cupin superfamily)